ncbi:lipoate-protein ligase B [Hyphomicrobium nitrativorans NL23]|uniref:Octanoyltransferase n=1 Tax=Hyphomicrobium nitrativorans NL23 TaxID=1029756 RepID=V5SES4_9HYPH|nr:lipoyl(octanoyl) transferase LipB [Hyphomicrobium nitrativorans]AHB48459.1 lipoate-protein ligase B [Hyphomicrobium nitrativorans NL23]
MNDFDGCSMNARLPQTSNVSWRTSPGLTPYPLAVETMERRAADIRDGKQPELVWLLEHPPLYTAGTSARPADLRDPDSLPVFSTGRGGQFTYHGPGQRIAYVMLDVQRRFGADVRAFVGALERWLIAALSDVGVRGETREGRVGIWIADPGPPPSENKIAALGIRIRRGVSFHGISLNVAPDLSHYAGIVPCGIAEHGVTSLGDLGCQASTKDVDIALRQQFEALFGPTADDVPLAETGALSAAAK